MAIRKESSRTPAVGLGRRDQQSDAARTIIRRLDERSRDVFATLVRHFLKTGEPVGSQTIVSRLKSQPSAATVRQIMATLQNLGLLYAPHVSSGRLPTDAGLQLFVESILQVKAADNNMRRLINERLGSGRNGVADVLEKATELLSGLSRCTGLVMAPRHDVALRRIEFVSLQPGQALAILVTEDRQVENRLIDVPRELSHSDLVEAANYLNARLTGRTLAQARSFIEDEIAGNVAQLDALSCRVVKAGLATWSGQSRDYLIIRGHARLMDDIEALEDIGRIRDLMAELESGRSFLKLVRLAEEGEGVRIFIGAGHRLFKHAGCSLVAAPFHDERQNIAGVAGVVGPSRMNYARIIPMVDYTAQIISHILDERR